MYGMRSVKLTAYYTSIPGCHIWEVIISLHTLSWWAEGIFHVEIILADRFLISRYCQHQAILYLTNKEATQDHATLQLLEATTSSPFHLRIHPLVLSPSGKVFHCPSPSKTLWASSQIARTLSALPFLALISASNLSGVARIPWLSLAGFGIFPGTGRKSNAHSRRLMARNKERSATCIPWQIRRPAPKVK